MSCALGIDPPTYTNTLQKKMTRTGPKTYLAKVADTKYEAEGFLAVGLITLIHIQQGASGSTVNI